MIVLSEDLISDLKKYRKVEFALAHAYEKSPIGSVAKYMLKGLALDSRKHAHMLKTVTQLEESREYVSDREKETMLTELEKHIEAEKNMLIQYQRFVSKATDPRVRSVLEHIAGDEERHHRILKTFHDHLLTKEYELDVVSYEWVKSL